MNLKNIIIAFAILLVVSLFPEVSVFSQCSITEVMPGEFSALYSPRHSAIYTLLISGLRIIACTENNGIVVQDLNGEWDSIVKTTERIYCLLENPENSSEILAGTEKGILRIYDFGRGNCEYLVGFPPKEWPNRELAVYTLIANEKTKSILAGTQQGIWLYVPNGTWQRVHTARTSYLAKNPENSDEVFAASDTGILRSTNSGRSWSTVRCEILSENEKVISLALGLNNDKTVIICAGTDCGKANGGCGRVLITKNLGKSWQESLKTGKPILSLAVDIQTNILMAACEEGIFASPDIGGSWPYRDKGFKTYSVNIIKPNGDKGNPLIFMASDKGIYKSSDLGESWKTVKTTNAHIHSIVTNSRNNEIFVGTNSGIFQSRDSSKSWSLEGLRDTNQEDISSIVKIPSLFICQKINKIYAGTYGYGVFIRDLIGEYSWQRAGEFPLGVDKPIVLSISVEPENADLFAGFAYNGVYHKVGLSDKWEKLTQGDLPPNATVSSLSVFSCEKNADSSNNIKNKEDTCLIVGTEKDGIYKGSRSESWFLHGKSKRLRVNSILVYSDKKKILAGTSEGIFASKDSGNNWNPHKSNLDGGLEVYSLVSDPGRQVLFAGTEKGIYQSSKRGISWKLVVPSERLGSEPAKALAVYIVDSEKYLLIGVQNDTADSNIYCYHYKTPIKQRLEFIKIIVYKIREHRWLQIAITIVITLIQLVVLFLIRDRIEKKFIKVVLGIISFGILLVFLFVIWEWSIAFGIVAVIDLALTIIFWLIS